LSTGASREAPVDNADDDGWDDDDEDHDGGDNDDVRKPTGKSRQVGGDGKCQQVLRAKHLWQW